MARRWPFLLVAALIAPGLATSLAQDAATSGAHEVPYPEGFRRWAHVKSALVGAETPGAGRYVGLHHVYANAKALEGYQTGRFPDGAVIAFDLLDVRTENGSTEEGPRKFTDVMHKDGARFASTGGWGFQEFEGPAHARTLDHAAAVRCSGCHERRAPDDRVISSLRE